MMSCCSFQSASSCTRPCCMRTLLKCLRASNVSRLQSLFIQGSPCEGRLGCVEQAGFETEAQVFVEPCPQMGLALWLEQVMECAHLGLVVGALPDLRRAGRAQLAVAGVAKTRRHQPRSNQGAVRCRLALMAGGNARACGQVTEAHAAFLPALGNDRSKQRCLVRCICERGDEDRVRGEPHDRRS